MVQWPEGSAARFDHDLAGWPLKQKHAEAKCEACHVAKYAVSPPANLSARKTGQGYTGLGTTCTSCHEDVHRAALGQNCTQCHDAASWTVTPGFDHDTTAYPLLDKHAEVKCNDCHLDARLAPKRDGKGQPVPVYAPVSFSTCQDCHADPHSGALGPKCADCHTTAGFQVIDKKRFDHDRTKYPLQGRHAAVSCADCHQDFSTPAEKKPAFATCASCHRDAHNGTATLAGKPVDCASCHTVAGYAPSTLHRGEPRDDQVPARGEARRGEVRRLPHPERRGDRGDALRQLEGGDAADVRPLHRLPRGRSRGPTEGTRRPRGMLGLSPGVRLDAQHLRQRRARAAEAGARRPAPAGGVRGLPRDGPEGAAPDERDGGGGGEGQLPVRGHRDRLRGVSRRSAPGAVRERRGAGEGRAGAGPVTARARSGPRPRASPRTRRSGSRSRGPTGRPPVRRVTRNSGRRRRRARRCAWPAPGSPTSSSTAKQGCVDCHTSPHGSQFDAWTRRVAARPVTRSRRSRRRRSSTTTPTRRSRSRAPTRRCRARSATCASRAPRTRSR